jgi:hypothetical protein
MPRTRATTILTTCIVALAAGGIARGQLGQTAMAPATGIANRAVAGFTNLNANGPGWLYYGINAADRGLGYNGSYMTLGGFIPTGEDDLGGLWAADLRGHLSVNGGFFSNVGAVRKQFLGGTLLGIGVYWDYDGDQNQYPTAGVLGSEWGQFGHAYNQVGVSGEWLTDFGNLRSNGYIPVGTTAYTLGAPGSPFYGNNILCQYGLDAALSGADLEVGAYIPGLSDWAGMISVGGYALGNARYDWNDGSLAGEDVVPWFGGVYTRLDMTFLENWDFSLQYNNDSYFDSTGFARLTYRMGGSRRRNVPDQVEQPMMRNEHIVRAHETPIAAVNPANGRAWRVLHVDNTANAGGNGSAGSPFRTLADAQAAATREYDVVFVRPGGGVAAPYATNWQFQADNQILVGAGSSLELATASCGFKEFFNTGTSGQYPTTSYPALTSSGTAITLRNGAIVDHLQVADAPVAIAAGPALTGVANVNDVIITGSNGPSQVGIQLASVPAGATVNFFNMQVRDAGRGLWVDGGAADITFQGLIAQDSSPRESVLVQNNTGGSVMVNRTTDSLDTAVASNDVIVPAALFIVQDTASTAPAAIQVAGNTTTAVSIGQAEIASPTQQGVSVQGNSDSTITFVDLSVLDAAAEAFSTQTNDSLSLVSIQGRSDLSSQSATLPVFTSNDDATLIVALRSVASKTVAPVPAISLQGTSLGDFSISDSFAVETGNPTPPPATIPAQGTDANVSNSTGVNVALP